MNEYSLSNGNITHVIHENGIQYIQFNHFNKFNNVVRHCFSTRHGGVSTGEFESLNLARNSEDPKNNRDENYRRLCDTVGFNNNQLVFSKQVHGTNIIVINDDNLSRFINNNSYECDGFVTNQKNVVLVTIYADCVPIYLFDPVKKVIALVHSGWKGTVSKIGAKALKLLVDTYYSNPSDILAGIGPSIGLCCFEVDKTTADLFTETFPNYNNIVFPSEHQESKYNIDLWRCNSEMLAECGLIPSNIKSAQLCTSCNNELFFSYRASNGSTSRNAAIMQLI